MERFPEIEEKGKVLYVIQSGEKIAEEYIEKEKITFPVIYSTLVPETKNDYTIYNQYGLGKMTAGVATKVPSKLRAAKKLGIEHGEYEGFEYQCPGQFVIDIDGKLIQAKKSWLDIDEIMKVL